MKLKNLLEIVRFSYGSDFVVEINVGFIKTYRLTRSNISTLMNLYGEEKIKDFIIDENKIKVRCRK